MLGIQDVVDPTPERLKLAAKILAKVVERWTVFTLNGPCIEWTGRSTRKKAYCQVCVGHRPNGNCIQLMVHRASYELFVAPIPAGLVIDHLCRNTRCANPSHLEPVSIRTNVVVRGTGLTSVLAAKTHCSRGHEFTPENTRIKRNGQRNCRECESVGEKARREAKRNSA